MGAESDSWQVGVCRLIGRDDFSLSRVRCGSDDEIMRSSRSALPSHGNEQLSVGRGDGGVVVDDGNDLGDFVDEPLASRSVSIAGEFDSHEEFGDGYCCDSYLVVVVDEFFQRRTGAVRIHQEGGVK